MNKFAHGGGKEVSRKGNDMYLKNTALFASDRRRGLSHTALGVSSQAVVMPDLAASERSQPTFAL